MTVPKRMKFGVFMAPFHRVGENPTLALERDLELLQWLDTLGFDEAYREQHGTFYTVETHIRFLLEVHEGFQISTDSYILGADQKRFHMHHDLLVDDDPTPVATQEAMLLHVAHAAAGDTPRAAPMVEPVLGNALALAERHATFPLPDHVGRGVRILR